MVLIIMCCQSINQFTFAIFETQQGGQHTGIGKAGIETVKQSDTVTHNFSSSIPNSCVLTALLSLNDSKCKLID